MSTTVDALLPLSLLEAVRNVDTPEDALEVEFVPELRNKRLGLSETVYAQIERYADAAKRKQPAVQDEAVALAKLIGRRPDAEAVLREAGRYLARQAYNTVGAATRNSLHAFPHFLARPWALRVANRIAERYLQGVVRRVGSSVVLTVPQSVTLDSIPQGNGCVFYEACFREVLSLLLNADSTVEHVRCAARGERACEWRAGWR
jgi:predicted hydrocarbon binding protein